MATTLGKISVDLTMGTAEFEAAINKTKAKTSELEKFFSGYGTKIVTGLGLGAIGAAFGSAISSANEFNRGLANIASLMPGNSEQVKQFGDAIQDLSIASGKSTKDLTDGMYQVVSAFGGGADAIDRLRIVSEASEAGLSTTTEALNLLSVSTKAYGDTSVEAMNKASDLAFKTVQLGQTTFPELANALQNVASQAAMAGVSQEELYASFAATTGVIGNASMVATKMKAALEALNKPSADLTKLYKELGVESGQALIAQEGFQGALEIVVNTAERSKIPLGNLIGSSEGMAFAASIAGAQSGKFAESLTEMGNAAGTTQRALEEQRNGLNDVGAALSRLSSSGTVALQKIGDAILSLFGSNSTKFINATTEAIRNFGKALDELSGNNPIEEQIASLKQLKDEVAGGELSLWDEYFGQTRKEQIADINKQIANLTSKLKANKEVEQEATITADKLKQKEEDLISTSAKRTKGIELVTESTKKAADEIKKLGEKYAETIKGIEKNKLNEAFSVAVKSENFRALDELGNKLKTVTKEEVLAGLDESIRYTPAAEEWADKIAEATASDKVKSALADIERIKLDAIEKETQAREDAANEILEIEQRNAEKISQIWEGAIIGGYESVANSANLREALKGIAETSAAAAAAFTGLPIDRIAQPFIDRYSELGKDSDKDRNLAIGTAATALLGGFLVPPNISESIGGGLSNILFGGADEDEKARDRIESFLEDTLQTNVVFGEGMQANWADAFGAIAGEGETAFESLGTVIALFAGQSAEMGGQVGFILAQNLNGNLDAARLLVQSLGIDAGQMGQALMDAALAGEMSWSQWAALQNEINTLTAEGLVGAGDLTGAWDQFLMTGGKGQISLTSLRNIAVEASEAGVTSLSELQAEMQKLGVSQEDINRFIQQLQANGIKNIDELASASNETLGSIVGSIENAGQQWDEYSETIQSAIDNMSELEKKVRGIEDREIDLVVNVKYKTGGDKVPVEVQEAALGGIFENIQKFASGGIVTAPTYFKHSGGLGLMGEAGREAIIPLGDGNKVRVEGFGGAVNFYYSIDARGAGAGAEAIIASAIKSAHKAAVRDSVSAISEAIRRGAL